MKTKLLSVILAAVSIAAGLPSVANAVLADDSAAIIAGSFSISQTTSPNFFAHIDYAVYAPGDYIGSYSFPDEYVYCYQLFNDSTSTSNIMSLTIDLETASIAYNPYYDAASGSGVSGGSTSLTPNPPLDAITYNFGTRSAITVNNHSVVLLFTSDSLPDSIMGTGLLSTTTAGNFSVQIPVPNPEPASLLLLTLASPFLLKTRRHK
jgi:hypothetical protein